MGSGEAVARSVDRVLFRTMSSFPDKLLDSSLRRFRGNDESPRRFRGNDEFGFPRE